ncbi:ankyrin repeat domain-containing protein [Pontibacter sp. G13]|uniref:ankyrin repeat domain-containing protein n=1 Tax=Pontibacter sp. G13 TaxID=3074898 RepID=UPI00288AD0B2|nr:ankyrin repeat domain-containing protein [Pontibacter sp. G13]WNJ16647.1 ankyrin repeat domain-containing protein [Pontibacter sp. G13]
MRLFEAICEHDILLVKAHLQQGGSPDLQDDMGSTLLHAAIREDSMDITGLLMEYGALVDSSDDFGNTPMHIAALFGNLQAAKLLAQWGVDIDRFTTRRSWTPLMVAINLGHLDMIDWFLTEGANVNHVGREEGWTPLMLAADKGMDGVTMELIQRGANVHAHLSNGDEAGKAAIHLAAYQGSVPIAEALVNQGGRPDNPPAGGGLTALHWAVYNEHNDLLDYFLGLNLNLNVRATGIYHGRVPLHYAISGKNLSAAEKLLRKGANPLVEDVEGLTPLDIAQNASMRSSLETYRIMIDLLEAYI